MWFVLNTKSSCFKFTVLAGAGTEFEMTKKQMMCEGARGCRNFVKIVKKNANM